MMNLAKPILIRNIQAGQSLEVFLVSAVMTLLSVRGFLYITGYPQVGNGSLHIAHMLWGGLLMLAALVLVYTWINATAFKLSVILGGAGFGLFIDELGKFITKDNNYFFQPTIALIYLIFVGLFFLYRELNRRVIYQPQEYLVNALRLLDEAALNDLDTLEATKIKHYLAHAGSSPLSRAMTVLIDQAQLIKPAEAGPYARAKIWIRHTIQSVSARHWFKTLLSAYFIFQAAVFMLVALALLLDLLIDSLDLKTKLNNETLFGWAYLATTAINSVMIVWGCLHLRHDYAKALLWLKRALLFSILVVHFFSFYQNQLWAVFSLGWDVIVYMMVSTLIDAEKQKQITAHTSV